MDPWQDLLAKVGDQKFRTILADPPWDIPMCPRSTSRPLTKDEKLPYPTLSIASLLSMKINQLCEDTSHLYLWVPNGFLEKGIDLLKCWGFTYKGNIIWHKVNKDNTTSGSGMGYYFRNATEICLFGTRGKNARTLPPARTQVNVIQSKRVIGDHSRKPEKMYDLIESCSPGPYLELFARHKRAGWVSWGNEIDAS